MSNSTADLKLITDEQLDELLAWSSGRKRITEMPLPRMVLTAALEELKRHRTLEHDAYWGDDDD